MTLDGGFTPEEFDKARRAEDTFAPVHVDARVYRDLDDADREVERRDLREILRAWGLGDADKMNALMLAAFLREFGRAPQPEYGEDHGDDWKAK